MKRARLLLCGIAIACGVIVIDLSDTLAADVIEEWVSVKMPPPPELRPVSIESKTTALLLLDFVDPNCTRRPRCVASMPAMKKLLTVIESSRRETSALQSGVSLEAWRP